MHHHAPLTIVDATLADGTCTSLRIVDGIVVEHGAAPHDGDEVLDAGRALALPALAEAHAHLDKAFLSEIVPNETGDLMGAIEGIMSHAHLITADGTLERVERAARTIAAHGATHIRTHVDVRHDNRLASVHAVVAVRERLRDLIDIEIVALSDWPISGPDGADQRALLRDALAAGADLVGGCPHLDPQPEPALEAFLEVAADAGVAVDLHTDEHTDPSRSTLEHLARRILATGFDRTVTASHCVSLGMMSESEQRRIGALLAEAGVHVVALPASNLYLQGRDLQQAMPRALTAIRSLRAEGVDVAAGWDNLQDPFNPMGRGDCLETASLMVMAGHLLHDEALDTVTNATRRLMGLPPAGTDVGMVADLVLVRAQTVRAALAAGPMPRTVVRRGQVLGPALGAP
ncbi:MAG: amidohydrolase family protein [Ilumatobacteraceae bacterium]